MASGLRIRHKSWSVTIGWLNALLVSLLIMNSIAGGIVISPEEDSRSSVEPRASTRVYVEPNNGTASVGGQYTVTVRIADVANLYGLDIQMRWGTAVLRYNSHTSYVGQPGGVLNQPIYTNIDEVNEATGPFAIPGATPGTTYWLVAICLGSAVPFNGSGIVFTMTFDVLRAGECDIYFTKVALANYAAAPIPFVQEDGYFYQHGLGQAPIADFMFFPGPAVQTRSTIFDASGSYDPDAGGGLALYIWNFKDGFMENTTSPTINHTFAIIPVEGHYYVELTVLDDQGGGSQSKPQILQVHVVHPRPVARFSVWPEDHVAVVDKLVAFDASASYDPDPGGTIVEYRWNFGDGNLTTTPHPTITHKYHSPNPGGCSVELRVVDDSDGLESNSEWQLVIVVQRRDIAVARVAASPSNITQGEDVTVDVAIANRGEAPESFNITAYYNATMTDWIKLDEIASNLPEQSVPEWEFGFSPSLNSTVYHVLRGLVGTATPPRDDTQVRVGADVGYWTLNPGLQNTAASSLTLVTGTPLPTGGWIWEDGSTGPEKLNGEFAAGEWAFKLKLYATQAGVNATIWTRILKSSNPDPQAAGALVTVIKDWTSAFAAVELATMASEFPLYNGNVSVPATVFTDEYLFFEFQLQVTANTASSAATNVVFQVGGYTGLRKSRIAGTVVSSRGEYSFSWDTQLASIGNHVVKIVTSEVPHDVNVTNNEGYSNAVTIVTVEHDVGVARVDTSRTIVGHGFMVSINITVQNYGSFLETFNMTVYANLTEIETIEIILQSGTSSTATLAWNTTDYAKGSYNITAYAWPVEGELNLDDNTFIDGWVLVTFPGDVDGDHDVDIFDIVRIAGVYDVDWPDPRYDPICDIDGDGDIDIFDVVRAAISYDKSW